MYYVDQFIMAKLGYHQRSANSPTDGVKPSSNVRMIVRGLLRTTGLLRHVPRIQTNNCPALGMLSKRQFTTSTKPLNATEVKGDPLLFPSARTTRYAIVVDNTALTDMACIPPQYLKPALTSPLFRK
jgi:hypothetical protein